MAPPREAESVVCPHCGQPVQFEAAVTVRAVPDFVNAGDAYLLEKLRERLSLYMDSLKVTVEEQDVRIQVTKWMATEDWQLLDRKLQRLDGEWHAMPGQKGCWIVPLTGLEKLTFKLH